ncbi:hypothetical protein SAMN05216419_104112 [Nitrosomonas cryotolerans]|nr:hypothetical protein SAMN05216419_104112 [Nitrosomonas cryotolerans]
MKIVIPSKKNLTTQRVHNKERYKLRHLVENFLFISRDAALPQDTPKILLHSLLLCKSDVLLSGQTSHEYTI